MPSLVFFEVPNVSVLVRRQQLAPKFSVGCFGGGQIDRKAQRIAEAFQGTIKVVKSGKCSKSGHIQIMELLY